MQGVALLILRVVGHSMVQGQASPAPVIIENVTLIDGTGKAAQPGMRVVIRDGVIARVEPASRPAGAVAGARVVNGQGKFLIPGLWDTHIHLIDVGEVAIPSLLASGVTSVRDMGGDVATLEAWRDRIDRGTLLGPRMKICGPMLEGKWDSTWAGGRKDHWAIPTPDSARRTVALLAAAGVDCIKMRSYADSATYFALAKAARDHRLPFGGHAPWGIDPIRASEAGQASFEHAFYPWPWADVSPEKKEAIEHAFRINGSMLVPTLIAWETFRHSLDSIALVVHDTAGVRDPRLRLISASLRKNWVLALDEWKPQGAGTPGWNRALDQHYELVAEMHEHGVAVMPGTDTGVATVLPGFGLLSELELLVRKCRFTPMDALLSATIVPAKFFGMEDRLGTIAPGKLADLVLLSADPLQDIANLREIVGVVARGRWLDRAALDGVLADVERQVNR